MTRIPQDVIDNVRNHVDIIDVISHYIPLTRKGKSFKCVCPFHDDHDPSMSISQEKQIYHCFVCGAGGNAFTFVQKYENISFVEAVLKVAKFANINIEMDSYEIEERKEDPHLASLHKVNQEAIAFCSYELDSIEGKKIKEYLYSRGLSDQIISKFELGYNPKENKLYNFLHAKKYNDQDIVGANLAWITANGIRDVFSNRIMIPIHDAYGKAVGFSARKVDSEQEAKYINTSETDVYVKGNLLYNYHRAKEKAKKSNKIIVVEGAMDVLAFEKAGIENCVATLGTACTKQQLKLLRYLGVKVVLCYDGDTAGQNAIYKFYKLAKEENLVVEIIENKYNLDPDEIIGTYGKDELILLSQKTQSFITFLFTYLRNKYDLNNYSEKKEFAMEIAAEINLLKDDFEKKAYYQRLSQISGFDMSIQEVKTLQNRAKEISRIQVIKHPIKGKINAQYQILTQMLLSKVASEYYRSELGFLLDKECNSLALYIVDYYRNNEAIEIADLLDYIKEDSVKKILLNIANWKLASIEYNEEVLNGAILKVKESMKEEKIKLLVDETSKMNDPIEKAKIAQKIILIKRNQGGVTYGKKDK